MKIYNKHTQNSAVSKSTSAKFLYLLLALSLSKSIYFTAAILLATITAILSSVKIFKSCSYSKILVNFVDSENIQNYWRSKYYCITIDSVFWFLSFFLSPPFFVSPFFFLSFISKSTFRASILTIQTEIEWISFLPNRCLKLNIGLKAIVRVRDLQKQLHGDMSFKKGILCIVWSIQYLKITVNIRKILIKEYVWFIFLHG